MSSFFGDELILGSYLSRILPILIGTFFLTNYSNKNLNIYLFTILVFLTFILIYLTGELAFLLTIMSITYITIMINRYSKLLLYRSIFLLFLCYSSSDQRKNDLLYQRSIRFKHQYRR